MLVEHVQVVCVCRSIMPKGLWGEGTLQHRSREVRQRSGVFIWIYDCIRLNVEIFQGVYIIDPPIMAI